MNYRYLVEQLRPVADSAAHYFTAHWGVTKFRIEEPLKEVPEYSPALHATTSDLHYLCVEVSERAYPNGLDTFVLACIAKSLPVRLVVAFPADSKGQDFNTDMSRAREYGVGVLEVSGNVSKMLQDPTPLSLMVVRRIELQKFPKKYRLALSKAENIFKLGDPSKGCSIIYDEIEDLSRKIAQKTSALGFWKPRAKGSPQKIIFTTHPWRRLIKVLIEHLDNKKCPYLPTDLLSRVHGVGEYRNDSGHKPNTTAALAKRNSQLRTRFESASDILLDLAKAAAHLKL